MGKKIFISYKYLDSKVLPLDGIYVVTTARHYVDKIDQLLDVGDHIFKGEDDGEDMSTLKDSTISSKLGDKIFDSSITIVLISKGMKVTYIPEKEQWIPWEISYSLKEQTRAYKTSKTNAVLAVVLPDESGSYSYLLNYDPNCNCTNYNTPYLFEILRKNMFNKKDPITRECNGQKVYEGYFSYIHCVKWDEFKDDINKFIDIAVSISGNKENYELSKIL